MEKNAVNMLPLVMYPENDMYPDEKYSHIIMIVETHSKNKKELTDNAMKFLKEHNFFDVMKNGDLCQVLVASNKIQPMQLPIKLKDETTTV
ncbi:MAG: hypothetical protein AABY32_01185 [Nanoarchaeota archaeon]